MIRLFHPFTTAGAMIALAACLISGCTETKRPARPAAAGAPATPQAGSAAEQRPAAAAPKTETAVAPPVEPAPAGPVAGESQAVPVADLVAKLAAAATERDRVLVIDEIGAIGQNALPALDALVAAFANAEPRVRWHAARAVGLIGEDARAAVPAIVKLLDDADPIVVTQAAAALAAIREDDGREQIPEADAAVYAAAVEPLAKTAVHADGRARRAAVRALRRYTSLTELAPIVSRHLADAEQGVVMSAVQTLAGMGDDAVPFLVEALKDPKSRYWAEVALAAIGPEAAPAAEALARGVQEGATEERLQAILALAAIGEQASATAPVIVGALEGDDAALRLPAAYALGRMRAAAGDEPLKRLAASGDPFLGGVAAWALARIHPDDRQLAAAAVERLRSGLADPDADARAACVNGLSDLAETLDAAARERLAGDFIGLLGDADPRVGRAAGAGLIRLGSAGVAVLRGKLADPALRPAVMEILAGVGPAAKPALAELVAALDDADVPTRGDAAVTIAAIGAEAVEAVPGLVKLVADASADSGLRYAAAFALGKIGPAAAAAEPVLRGLATSSDELMATVAVWAALKIKPDDSSLFETAIPLLRRALRGDREMVRLEAAVALGDIGPAASSAIPILELVSEDDPVKQVRTAAAAALRKIRGPQP